MFLKCLIFIYLSGTLSISANLKQKTITKISPEIINELKDFGNLIPDVVLDEIIAEHFLIDGDFRKALKFLRSTQFTQLIDKSQKIPEVIEILEFLHINENAVEPFKQSNLQQRNFHQHQPKNVPVEFFYQTQQQMFVATTLNKNNSFMQQFLEIVLLVDDVAALPTTTTITIDNLGSFASFVEELMEHLPRQRYVEMINEKCKRNAAFAKFYAALRNEQFPALVESARNSKNLMDIMKELSDNRIYVTALEPIAWKVLSWGPPVGEV